MTPNDAKIAPGPEPLLLLISRRTIVIQAVALLLAS
jgi:hypothetical protein